MPGSWSSRIRQNNVYAWIALGAILSLVLRFSMIDYVSRDYTGFFSNWYDFIVEHGGFSSLRYEFANYNPPYLYMMLIVIKLFPALPKLYVNKFISIFFDYVLCFFVYKLVRLKYGNSIACFFGCMAFLFAPTVFFNSALWGQIDAIYTSGLIACLYFLCVKRPYAAMAAFGFAFSIKLQAMFFAPFVFVLFIKKELPWRSAVVAPAVFLLSLIPAWIAGRPLLSLLLIYVNQSSYYHELTKHAPTFYVWFPNSEYAIFYRAGTLLAAAVALCYVAGAYRIARLNPAVLVQLALTSILSMVYFLPKMHDRYFFAADVCSIVYAFYYPRYFFVPVTIIFCSLMSYLPYLFGIEVPFGILSITMGVVLLIVVRHLVIVSSAGGSPATEP
jgi:Gpi18-like mannosyltransferase